ncbi:MAG: HlyD family efflux transporter periplasmic adaptor subunit [Candidatus Hydrogenedentes bacterium]|nr:HlyD family efflux transporter periplasmic adaptor subunit [Candidatus Hydrogenedentota bacterium]
MANTAEHVSLAYRLEKDLNYVRFLMGAICVVLTAAGCDGKDNAPIDVTGQIEAVTVAVGSRVGGRVSEVLVEEGARVKQGDVLVKLETNEAEAAIAAAQARLAQAGATLTKLETGARPEEIRQAEAAAARAEAQYQMAQKGSRKQEVRAASSAVDAARAQRDEAKDEFERVNKLREGSAVSQQLYDQAEHALQAAEAQWHTATERLNMAVEGARSEEIAMAKAAYDQAAAARDLVKNGARKEDIDAARAVRDAAEADVQRARIADDEMAVKSPRDAVVESLDIHPGDLVKPGAVASLVDPEDLKVYIYVTAFTLGRLRVGEKIPLTADAYGTERFAATVDRIASQGEFTPRNLQTKEERAQQVFGVKLKLDSAGGKLRPGMTVTAHLPTNPAE